MDDDPTGTSCVQMTALTDRRKRRKSEVAQRSVMRTVRGRSGSGASFVYDEGGVCPRAGAVSGLEVQGLGREGRIRNGVASFCCRW
jgi:hypothetical protein